MNIKKLIALLLALTVCVSLLAGCNGNSGDPTETTPDTTPSTEATEPSEPVTTDPVEMIKDSYYVYSYFVEGIGEFTYYLHFYDEAPVLGSVFYAGYALNQINFTGTYVVEETPCEYSCYAHRGDTEMVTGTAPYTVIFYDWEGNELDRCGFDGEILYNDMETIAGTGHGPNYYTRDTDGSDSKYIETYEAEVDIKYADFVAENPTSTVTLYHNGRYMDLMDMMIEGSWEIISTDETGTSFKLTPDLAGDTAATLVVSADKKTAVYTPDGGEAVNVTDPAALGPQAAGTLVGQYAIPGQDNLYADVILTMYSDGTCDVILDAFGTVMPLDAGTYAMGDDGFTIHFTFTAAGEVSTVLNENYLPTLHYVQAGTGLGDIELDLVADLG